MGLFPRTIDKRFLRARMDASFGAPPCHRLPGRITGRRRMPGWDHAEPCIFIRHHKMWGCAVRLSRDRGDRHPLTGPGLCEILDANFGE